MLVLLPMMVVAQTDSIANSQDLHEIVVQSKGKNREHRHTMKLEMIDQSQLIRAACCNLGESFTASPSVDVSYSDAATGARQIKLLGLSGTYVQMLTENVPNLRGAAIPYSLGYIPGPWMQSIQVSKGASSVKNGYESTTGQINIEFLKPQATDGVRGNAYFDSNLKMEANADASIHLNPYLSTSLLLHYENRQTAHDGNGDGFMDMPKIRQYNIMHRWAYVSPKCISQLSLHFIKDERTSGQSHTHSLTATDETALGATLPPSQGGSGWVSTVNAERYELQWKNGFTLNPDRNESIALMLHGSLHDAENQFGHKAYDVNHKNGYAQLMYESDFGEHHNLNAGASLNHDYFAETINLQGIRTKETVPGIYAQYTYKLHDKLTTMLGFRYDHSSLWGGFVTPRIHVKYSPSEGISLRASAGKGYRTAHAYAENVPLMASGSEWSIEGSAKEGLGVFQEEAWNYGLSANLNIPIGEKTLELNAEYYYTHFLKQMVVNAFHFSQLGGRSFSHTVQVDATYPFFEGFSATAAFRYNDARTTYEGFGLRQRPLTSRYKGLLTLSYKTPMDIWQFDVTGQLNGPGHFYYEASSGSISLPLREGRGGSYPSHFLLQAQVTRDFRHFSIYLGGENLTNYKIKNPIIGADNPWSTTFDATQVWGPIDGAMAYVGVRYKLEKQ